MTFEDHFSGVAAAYKSARPSYPEALLEYIAGLSPQRDCAWDCGTGTGQVARALADRFARVEASDASAEQIAEAAPHKRVHFFVAPAEQSGLPDASVDLICAGAAAHWFDHPRFYDEVRRVARPDAAIALFSYGAAASLDHPVLDELVMTFALETVDAHWPDRISYLKERYRTLPFPFADLDVPPFAIEVPASLPAVLGFVRTWSATQRAEAAAPGTYAQFAERFAAAWDEAEEKPATLTLPLFMRAAQVGSFRG